MVLDAVQVMGLKACVVHPSGILGPNDHAIGETTNTLLQIIKGEMPMGMQGSFNLCDVRDLAAGTIAAVDKGRIGECYILANKTVTLKEMCDMLHKECNAKKIKFYLPLDLADKIAAGLEKQAEKTGKMPLMTTFSVYNLARNNEFDCTKAKTELGYTTRSYEETIHDEVQWMIAEGLIDGNGVTEKPALMTNEQIREGGYMEDIVKAMEHEPALPEIDVEKTYKAIGESVVATYQKIEDGVVGGYQKIENGAVGGFRKISDFFIKKFFSRKGETVEETRKRLSRK
jgi:hypothetical protein